MHAVKMPRSLRPGDRVAVVAPASPFPESDLAAGLSWLGARYDVVLGDHLYNHAAYLAGSDADRIADVSQAMRDPEVRAIVCARGGYGILRIVDALPWTDFARNPQWICGFSDVTALLTGAFDHGVGSLHAHNLTGLGRTDSAARDAFVAMLEAPKPAISWTGLQAIHHAARSANGQLYGGNLALLHALAAANRLHVPRGSILLMEDTTERPYRLDRMLTTLRLGGHLARASAIVFGEMTECGPGADGRLADDVLADCTSSLDVPVVRGAPFGHGAINCPFVLGMDARLEGGTLRATTGGAAI